MGADFSRVRSNPLRDFAAVELKQGAVLLDADANELVAILDRRLRALASDVLGRATIGANTPDAFRINLGTTSTGELTLSIGPGRLYVDGLLAENHGVDDPKQPPVLDALLGEPTSSGFVPYADQPYLPVPPPLPRAGRHLVYLDVWNREVTHLEDPALVESAVGVETTSRLQTVWQVRVWDPELGGNVTCGSPDAEVARWAEFIAPSTGRLTTGTYDSAEASDPCELPPTGGYRGLENQLYRVEIHDAGAPGTATFKWSRENASVGSRIASWASNTRLVVDSLGRDALLAFKQDDWVEVIDDHREFSLKPGEMRRIVHVDPASREITLHAPLPTDLLPAQFPGTLPADRNARVRLWSQAGKIHATAGNGATTVVQDLDDPTHNGLIKVPAAAGTTLLLEHGVTVAFDNLGSRGFKSGDFWVFAARTADASVEKLRQAPPRGVHHHYARLSIWEAGTNNEPSDCRHPWPPKGGDDCACTQCVSPESHRSGQLTIQDAVRRVQERGGTVCLEAGEYVLDAPVRVTGARSVRIRGQGQASIINTAGCAFRIESSHGIVIENLGVISTGKQPAIAVSTGFNVTLQGLTIVVANIDAPSAAIALGGSVIALNVRDNLIGSPFGIRALDRTAPEPQEQLMLSAAHIEDNLLICTRRAIDLSGTVYHLLGTHIRGNDITACRDTAIMLLGSGLIGSGVHVEDNTLTVNGPGIQCGLNFVWIEGNRITATAQEDRPPTGAGITLLNGFDQTGSDKSQVLANQVSDYPGAGILVTSPVRDLICKLNIIDRCGAGIVLAPTGPVGAVSIENNHLRDIGARGATPGASIHGIVVRRAETANVVGNTLRRIGVDATRGVASVAGIAHFAVRHSRLSGNDIVEVGPAGPLPGAEVGGILLHGPYTHNEIHGNHVARDAVAAGADESTWRAVAVTEASPARPIVHVADFATVHLTTARMLVLDGTHAFAVEAALDFANPAAPVPRGSSIAMRGNVMQSRGAVSAVALNAGADIQFGDNRCELTGKAAAVTLDSGAAVVSTNVVRSLDVSVRLTAAANRVSVIGNATTGDILVGQSTSLGTTPWASFNARI